LFVENMSPPSVPVPAGDFFACTHTFGRTAQTATFAAQFTQSLREQQPVSIAEKQRNGLKIIRFQT